MAWLQATFFACTSAKVIKIIYRPNFPSRIFARKGADETFETSKETFGARRSGSADMTNCHDGRPGN